MIHSQHGGFSQHDHLCCESLDDDLMHAPIGIFDSGVGGLTVLKAIARQLPGESLLYVGDTARLPYGTRTQADIIQFVREILSWMQSQGAKIVVMACNTSSALALDIVRTEFEMPVLGVILPAARVAATCGKRIGVIATPATAASRSYTQAILENDPSCQVWEVGCPEFVPLIEQNKIYAPKTVQVVSKYLDILLSHGIDTLIYGCTHYPHLKPVIDTLMPPSVMQVDPAVHVAIATDNELQLLGLKHPDRLNRTPYPRTSIRFCVSDQPERFSKLSAQWLGYMPTVEHITLASTIDTYR
jgi:glutamate racemase